MSLRTVFRLIKRPPKAVLLVLAGIALLTVFFLCRKPVILVTDRAFTALYGEKRTLAARFGLSIRLFRQVKTISMALDAGPDLVEQGAVSLSRRPFAVFFPYRYREGARRYRKNRPDIPVIVLAGRQKPRERREAGLLDIFSGTSGADAAGSEGAAEPLWVYTDTETDFYRAGAFAGAALRFAGEHPEIIPGRDAAVFETKLGEAEKAAFGRGLAEQGWNGEPLFSSGLAAADALLSELPETEDAPPPAHPLACAVLLDDFRLGGKRNIGSFIIFGWMDPALSPRRTLAVFDDSPWTQIVPALGFVKQGGEAGEGRLGGGLIPSAISFPGGDKTLKSVYTEIKKLKNLTYRAEMTDN